MSRVSVALLHHPCLGRQGEVLTTTLTNFDLHDISRCVRTYGLHAFYAVHPYASQRMLASRIQQHWVAGAGGKRIPDRSVALDRLRIVADVAAIRADLGRCQLWTTAASAQGEAVTSFADARTQLSEDGPPIVICFGTGWGLAPSFMSEAELRLEPIVAARDSDYNHLSVRAAVAITLDRLFGAR